MAFITKSEARTAAFNATRFRSAQSILTSSLENHKEAEPFDIFLSHSSDDQKLVLGVMKLLQEQGLTVYVDWVVDDLLDRNSVNKNTANTLRDRMKHANSMIYMATDNSTYSKWMPWELGFFDGYKPDHIAILPVLDSENQKFEGQEYLTLYPLVSKYTQNGVTDFVVGDDDASRIKLKDFAKGTPTVV